MAKAKNPRCRKQVVTYEGLARYEGQCLRQGSVQRDGKWYCKQHDPEAEAARAKASDERRAQESAERKAKWDREDALKKLGQGLTTEQLQHASIVVDADYRGEGSENVARDRVSPSPPAPLSTEGTDSTTALSQEEESLDVK